MGGRERKRNGWCFSEKKKRKKEKFLAPHLLPFSENGCQRKKEPRWLASASPLPFFLGPIIPSRLFLINAFVNKIF